MIHLLHEEITHADNDRQELRRFMVRPLDGKSEGRGLAVTVEIDGATVAEFTIADEDAITFSAWISEAIA